MLEISVCVCVCVCGEEEKGGACLGFFQVRCQDAEEHASCCTLVCGAGSCCDDSSGGVEV